MEEKFLITFDNIKIAINFYKNNCDGVVIIAPGWCMTKDSFAFKGIAQFFSEKFDVISMDFRGHGKSGGFYTFTAKELFDMDAVITFAQKQGYKNIYLVGFSLGAAVSLICASRLKYITKVIAVSAPCAFSKIENHMWKKEAWLETLRKFELGRFLSIRPSIFPSYKIEPINIVKNIKAPTLFVAGKKDPTVYCWHTEKLYNEAKCQKDYKLYENGCHAEDLYLHYKDDFSKMCLNWLEKE